MDTNNVIVDVVYDNEQIYHVLEPNLEGIRGIPITHFMLRDTIGTAKENLKHLELGKIEDFENELLKKLI